MVKSARWILVSNRLPMTWDARSKELKRSSGGLVTALSGIRGDREMWWIGTAPSGAPRQALAKVRDGKRFVPVAVDDAVYDEYYNGVCNDALWPLLHSESDKVHFAPEKWRAYETVNRAFADEIVRIAKPDDLVWVHDFHLFLLPALLKARRPGLRVGFFLHTPFPTAETFSEFPMRREILNGLLAADLVGFHDYAYLRHFSGAVSYLLGFDPELLSVRNGTHLTELGVFPVSIDTAALEQRARSSEVRSAERSLARKFSAARLVLGIDRLDYSKGLPQKLRAFARFLEQHPEMRGEVSLLQVAIPSRTDVPEYVQLRLEIEQLVGEINGKYGSLGYVPVHYLFSSVGQDELLALYRHADVLLVTSKRDGMNLVSLEYVAVQPEQDPGVVVLSEFAGAHANLSHALSINPFDVEGTARTLHRALTMRREQRLVAQREMRTFLRGYTATEWASSFMKALRGDGERAVGPRVIDDSQRWAREVKANGAPLLIFSDFDGTLAAITSDPARASLTREMRDAVRTLARMPRVHLVIISGRDRAFLERQFEGIPLTLVAEHGALWRHGGRWRVRTSGTPSWYSEVRSLMRAAARRVPGSFVEEKRFSLTWHFRNAPREFGEFQARKLKYDLEVGLATSPALVRLGRKIVEVRPIESNKGAFARWYLQQFPAHGAGTVVAFGDDEGDELLFESLDELDAFSVKVGREPTLARFRLQSQPQMEEVLRTLASVLSPAPAARRPRRR